MNDLLSCRTDYKRILDIAQYQMGYIPDGSIGINNLLNLYYKSSFKEFYDWYDSEDHEPWETWNKTYRNYRAIFHDIPEIRWFVERANPFLLQPDKLEYLINIMFDRGWSPKHIGGFIRSIYENPEILWNNKFAKYDASRWANGWVQIVLSNKFI